MRTVGFYGHSGCAYRDTTSYLDLFATLHNLGIVNWGVKQGSEERILYELKKTASLDLAIIFHSEPQYLFLPNCDRDIGLNNLREFRAEYLFRDWESQFTKSNHGKFLAKFKEPQNFLNVMGVYKEYFYTPDLQMNRFTGALIQIDQYCTSKGIPVIHITNSTVPQWFKFTSGIINSDINQIFSLHKSESTDKYINGVTELGNQLVCDRLTELAESLLTSSPGSLAQW